jgi:hypothetical protein
LQRLIQDAPSVVANTAIDDMSEYFSFEPAAPASETTRKVITLPSSISPRDFGVALKYIYTDTIDLHFLV